MGGHHHHFSNGPAARSTQTQRVAVVSALVNLLLSAVKLIAGFMANSAALIADGIHSVSDLLSDALVWVAALHAGHGPDEEHPYGHGRFETAATLGLGILLLLVALGIAWDAALGLFSPEKPIPGTLAIYAAFFSIVVNEGLYWYTLIVARRINSDMLRANAWHHRTDAVSSIVVLVGVAGAIFGWPYLDGIAAIIVGVMVAKIGWDLGWEAMQELVDASLDEQTVERARATIEAVDGVRSIHMLRTRSHGPDAAADVHVQVAPRITVSEGHMISQAVEDELKREIDQITDVTVHIDPEDDEGSPPCRGLPLRHDTIALLRERCPNLPQTAEARLHYLGGKVDLELILPLSEFVSEEVTGGLREKMVDALRDESSIGRITLLYR